MHAPQQYEWHPVIAHAPLLSRSPPRAGACLKVSLLPSRRRLLLPPLLPLLLLSLLLNIPHRLPLRRHLGVEHALDLPPPPLRQLAQLLLRLRLLLLRLLRRRPPRLRPRLPRPLRPLREQLRLAGPRCARTAVHAGPGRVSARPLVLALQQWLAQSLGALAQQVCRPRAQAARGRGRAA